MKRDITLEEISDGKRYTSNDLAKTECGGCKGCSVCCQGMGESIVLDPYDVWQLKEHLQMSFEELLENRMELHVVDGMILPNLQMKTGEEERCSFLNQHGRCDVHAFRPGICRLFPLGRYYENHSFSYILQTHECANQNRTKVKIKKWLGIPDLKAYEKYISQWHYFLNDVREQIELSTDENMRKQWSMLVLQEFYLTDFGDDFYSVFGEKVERLKHTFI